MLAAVNSAMDFIQGVLRYQLRNEFLALDEQGTHQLNQGDSDLVTMDIGQANLPKNQRIHIVNKNTQVLVKIRVALTQEA